VTVEEVIFKRAGLLRGSIVAVHFQAWAACARALGHFPTAEEVAAHHGKSERQVWRYRAAIRRSLSEDEFRAYVSEAMKHDDDPVLTEVPVVRAA
jgi:beta-phosphoglucomutase-like phosphatase (HAD superfamily)